MRVSTMRAVDRWLGRPAAAVLTGLRRILGDAAPTGRGEVRKVLFVKLSEMGALVLSAPAFAEVARVFPNAETWLLCFEENADVALLAGGLPPERVVTVPAKTLGGTLIGLLRAIRRLRRERFDVAIDLEFFSRVSTILAYVARVRVRAGYHRFEAEGLYCGDLYTHRVTWNPYLHVAQAAVVLVRAAAADPRQRPLLKEPAPALAELPFPRFSPGAEDLCAVHSMLAAAGVPPGAEILLVNPNASDLLPLRRWPEQRFVDLCALLLARRPAAWVVLTGAEHEAPLGERILESLRAGRSGPVQCVSLIGRTSLRELLALFSLARALVSSDSGPPHFATLTDLQGVVLFGPETPSLYGPVTPRIRAMTLGLACSPCIHVWNRRVSPCDDNQCMKRIRAEDVADAVLGLDAPGR